MLSHLRPAQGTPAPAHALSSPATKHASDPFESLIDRAVGRGQGSQTEGEPPASAPTHPGRSQGTGRGAGSSKPSAPSKPNSRTSAERRGAREMDASEPHSSISPVQPEPETAQDQSTEQGTDDNTPEEAADSAQQAGNASHPTAASGSDLSAILASVAAPVQLSGPALSATATPVKAHHPERTGQGMSAQEAEPVIPHSGGTETAVSRPKPAPAMTPQPAESIEVPTSTGAEMPPANLAAEARGNPVDAGCAQPGTGPALELPAMDAQATGLLGTAGAKDDAQMKKPEELLKTAEPAQQNLPSAAVLGGSAATTLSGGAFSANSTAHPHFSLPASITASSVAAAANAAPVPELSHVSPDARLSALERTHELVSLHAVRLSNASTDTMRVVIEPGAGLNLSLELRWHKDGIDVQASLHRGDYEHLSRHWSELQRRLEPRGIHLGALECPNASVSDHSSYQQSARQAADREPAPSALAEFTSAVTNTTTSASRSVVSTHRGWETWA